MKLSSLIVLCTCLGTSSAALAQFPNPLLGQEKAKPKKKRADKAEEAKKEAEGPKKDYQKPAPVTLPEGEAKKLSGKVAIVPFSGIVNPGMGNFTIDSIERAQREGAQMVLIEMDTPGGLVSTTQKMVQAILGARIPVIVHVTPSGAHAASAGTFITLAAHIAVMSPATRIGAAHPVTGDGKDPEAGGKHMAAKVENDLVAMVSGIAKERNRNIDWAKDAVIHSVSINADRALEIGVIDLIARDRQELLEALDGRELMVDGEKVALQTKGVSVEEYQPSLRNAVLNLLANPGIAMLLGVLGLIGVMVEIYHPGMIAPGVMGVLCILCSLIAMEQMPIDLGAAILIIAGIGLLVAELYTPTYGALGVLGGLGLALGMVLLVDTGNPDFALDKSFALTWVDTLPVVALLVGFVGYISYFVLRQKQHTPLTGQESLVGQRGKVLKAVGPQGGQVFVGGEYWQARSESGLIEGTEVEVVQAEGLELTVRARDA